MSSEPGYLNWGIPQYRDLYLDGYPILGRDLSDDPGPHASRLQMADGSAVTQVEITGDTGPMMRATGTFSLGVDIADKEDKHRVERACRAQPVPVWLELTRDDQWIVLPGQTSFSTLRTLPYGGTVTGVTEVTHPMSAWVDGVAQTLIYSGTPIAGEVKVSLAAGAQWRAVTTSALATSSRVVLRYYPVIYGLCTWRMSIPTANGMESQISIQEVNPGRWD